MSQKIHNSLLEQYKVIFHSFILLLLIFHRWVLENWKYCFIPHQSYRFSLYNKTFSFVLLFLTYQLWIIFKTQMYCMYLFALMISFTAKNPHDFLFFFLLEYNCFTMLCQFLLYNEVNQLCIYIYPLPLGPTPKPTHLGHHRAPS